VGGKFVGRLTYRHSSQGAQGIDCLHGAHGPAGVPQLSGFWQVDLQATPLHSSSEPQLSGASRAALSSWVQAHHRPAHRRHASLHRACFGAYSSRELHVNLRGKISSYAKGINESPSSPPCAWHKHHVCHARCFPAGSHPNTTLCSHVCSLSLPVPSPRLFPLLNLLHLLQGPTSRVRRTIAADVEQGQSPGTYVSLLWLCWWTGDRYPAEVHAVTINSQRNDACNN